MKTRASGLEKINFDDISFCEHCVIAKQVNKPYGNGIFKATRVFQKLVADLQGPFPSSPSGFKYALDITDVYSGWIVTFALRHKGEAAALVEQYIRTLDPGMGLEAIFSESTTRFPVIASSESSEHKSGSNDRYFSLLHYI